MLVQTEMLKIETKIKMKSIGAGLDAKSQQAHQ
jgi:hypothetical protein